MDKLSKMQKRINSGVFEGMWQNTITVNGNTIEVHEKLFDKFLRDLIGAAYEGHTFGLEDVAIMRKQTKGFTIHDLGTATMDALLKGKEGSHLKSLMTDKKVKLQEVFGRRLA